MLIQVYTPSSVLCFLRGSYIVDVHISYCSLTLLTLFTHSRKISSCYLLSSDIWQSSFPCLQHIYNTDLLDHSSFNVSTNGKAAVNKGPLTLCFAFADSKYLLLCIPALLLVFPTVPKLWPRFQSCPLVSVCLFAPHFTHAPDLSNGLSFFRGIGVLHSVAQLTHLHYHQWMQCISTRVSSQLYNLVIQALWLVRIEFRAETSLNGMEVAEASSDHPVLLLLPHKPWPSEDAYYSPLICLS